MKSNSHFSKTNFPNIFTSYLSEKKINSSPLLVSMMFFFILEWCWLLLVQRLTGLMFFLAEENESAGRQRRHFNRQMKMKKLDFEL